MKHAQSVLIRSTVGGFEPRFRSAQELLSELFDSVSPIVWSRTPKDSIFLESQSENILQIPAGYGRGKRNFFSHLKFFFFIMRRLRIIRPQLIYACDLDTLIPSLFWAMNRKVIVVFDQFDPLSARISNPFLSFIVDKIEYLSAQNSQIRISANKFRVPKNQRDDWFELKNVYSFRSNLNGTSKITPPYILFYGGILSQDRGLLACADVVSQEPDWEFHLYGQGVVSTLLANRKYKNVILHEPLPHEELIQLAKNSDLFLAMYDPSRSHNRFTASNKLFEAAQLGRPLLANTNTHIGETVASFNLGWTVNYNNEKEIRKVLREVIENSISPDQSKSSNLKLYFKLEVEKHDRELDVIKSSIKILLEV